MRAVDRVLVLTGLVALAAAAAAPSGAVAADEAGSLPAIVVTATRSEKPSFEVPASVDSVRMVDVRDSAGINPSEFLDGIPGVLARDRQNYAQDEQISIRGFGARSTFGVRGVRLYTDGIPATMPDGQGQVSHFNLDSAERIEVLRGPFSALYGNSSGGVIEIFTADGSDPPRIGLDATGGSFGTWRASANARGFSGPLGYNLDLTHFQTSGYRDHSAAKRESGNAKLTWTNASGGKLTLLANTLAIPGAQDPLGLTREQFEQDPSGVAGVALQYDTRKSVHQAQAGAVWEQELGHGQRLRVLGYAGQRDIVQYLSVPVGAQGNPLHSGGVIDLGSRYGGTDARWSWQGELAGRDFEVTAGVAWDRQRQHRLGYENFVGEALGVRGALRRDEHDTVRDFDQYAQATWQFADHWSVLAGVRHSDVAFDADDRYVTGANPDDSGSVDYGATTPVAALSWQPDARVHAYASWGRGFETPTFSELGYRADGGAGFAFDLVPARSRNAELGLKLRPVDALEARLALFRADTRDELAVATSAGGRTTYQNIGEARRSGAEASLAWRPATDWRLQLAWTRVDARFRSGFLACSGVPCFEPDTPVPAGSRIPGIPRNVLDARLDWGGETGWHAGTDVRYLAEVPVNDTGSDAAPAYTVADASLGYAGRHAAGRWNAFVRVDNLFDRRYAGSVIVNDSNGRFFEPAPGRTFLVGFALDWSH